MTTFRPLPDGIGIPWYRREDYPAILDLMEDRERLPPTFEHWENGAQQAISQCEARGIAWHRAHIDPKNFRAWCLMRGLHVDAAARGEFASNPINWDRAQKH